MTQYYQQSQDYLEAYKLMRLGQPLAVYLDSNLSIIRFAEYGMLINEKLQPAIISFNEFEEFVKGKVAQFILPIANPTGARIKCLEQALSDVVVENSDRQVRIEELLDEIEHKESQLKDLQIAVNSDDKAQTIRLLQIQIENYQALLEGFNEASTGRDRQIRIEELLDEIEALEKKIDD